MKNVFLCSIALCVTVGGSVLYAQDAATQEAIQKANVALNGLSSSGAASTRNVEIVSADIEMYRKLSEIDKRNEFPVTYQGVLESFTLGDRSVSLFRNRRDGERSFQERKRIDIAGELKETFIDAYDGQKTTSFHAPKNSIGNTTIVTENQASGSLITSPWAGNLSGKYGSELKDKKAQIVGEESTNGVKTVKLETKYAEAALNQSFVHTVWIAPEKSYREVRKDIRISLNAPKYKYRRTRYETLSFSQFRGQWVPKTGVLLNWLVDDKGRIYWNRLEWFELDKIGEIPQSDGTTPFNFESPLGARINNQISEENLWEGINPLPYVETLKENKYPDEVRDFVRKTVEDAVKEVAQKN